MTTKRRWPAATDYIDAMQHPGHVFRRPELKNAAIRPRHVRHPRRRHRFERRGVSS